MNSHIIIVYMNKYYHEKTIAEYIVSKRYISMKQNFLIFEKKLLCWISYMMTKK